MTDANIEEIVGVRRHPSKHIGRVERDSTQVYVLHSQSCIDNRGCIYTRAARNGIDPTWRGREGHPVFIGVAPLDMTLRPGRRVRDG